MKETRPLLNEAERARVIEIIKTDPDTTVAKIATDLKMTLKRTSLALSAMGGFASLREQHAPASTRPLTIAARNRQAKEADREVKRLARLTCKAVRADPTPPTQHAKGTTGTVSRGETGGEHPSRPTATGSSQPQTRAKPLPAAGPRERAVTREQALALANETRAMTDAYLAQHGATRPPPRPAGAAPHDDFV